MLKSSQLDPSGVAIDTQQHVVRGVLMLRPTGLMRCLWSYPLAVE